MSIQSFCITWKDHLLVNNQIVLPRFPIYARWLYLHEQVRPCQALYSVIVYWDNWRMHGYNRMIPGFLFYLLSQILMQLWLTKFQFWLLLLEFYCKKYSDFPYLIKLMFLFPVWTIWHGQKVQLLNLSVFHFTLHLMSSKPF